MTVSAAFVRSALRLVAVAIAVAAFADPVFTSRRPVPLSVNVRSENAAAAAATVEAQLARALGDRIRFNSPEPPSDVILVGRPTMTNRVGSGIRVSTVSVSGRPSPNVWVNGIVAPDRVLAGYAAAIVADVRARGMSGRTSAIVLEHQGIEVARVEHPWRSDDDRFPASFAYAAPATGLASLRIAVRPLQGEITTIDNAADVGMIVDARRLRVLVYEPRPSWAAGFVRRVLENDPAFDVASIVRPSRGIAVTAGHVAPLRAEALERFDAAVIGAPEELSQADTEALATFARRRGGTVIFLPDRRPTGAFLRVLPVSAFEEVLLEAPVSLTVRDSGLLRASEFALPRDTGRAAIILAAITPRDRSAVLWWPLGTGRILFSGTLDAWRYRAHGSDGFSTFWRAAISTAALAAPPRVAVSVDPLIAAPAAAVRIRVVLRRTEFEDQPAAHAAIPAIRAQLIAEDGRTETVRLWPSSEAGVYEGTVRASCAGRYNIRVTSTGAATDAVFVVRDGVRQPSPDDRDILAALAAATGGRAADLSDLSPIVEHLRQSERPHVAAQVRPLRSPWWILPFAGALCAEWALRRRGGLR